jgi:hypothetical protein
MMARLPITPSSGTPGEGWGGGLLKVRNFQNPHPNPPPEYLGREQALRNQQLTTSN